MEFAILKHCFSCNDDFGFARVQTAAATGRIASNNPNLQAIPKSLFNLVLFSDDANPQGNVFLGSGDFSHILKAKSVSLMMGNAA